MSDPKKLVSCTLAMAFLAACASADTARPDSTACALPVEASPPSAATPTGPTAMNPPAGYPPLMNPTVPVEIAATPSNMGYGGARNPSTSTSAAGATHDACERQPRPAGS